MESKLIADRAACPVSAAGENAATYTFLGLFAILLAFVTSKHEMYVDEGQAWLIARKELRRLPSTTDYLPDSEPGEDTPKDKGT